MLEHLYIYKYHDFIGLLIPQNTHCQLQEVNSFTAIWALTFSSLQRMFSFPIINQQKPYAGCYGVFVGLSVNTAWSSVSAGYINRCTVSEILEDGCGNTCYLRRVNVKKKRERMKCLSETAWCWIFQRFYKLKGTSLTSEHFRFLVIAEILQSQSCC